MCRRGTVLEYLRLLERQVWLSVVQVSECYTLASEHRQRLHVEEVFFDYQNDSVTLQIFPPLTESIVKVRVIRKFQIP